MSEDVRVETVAGRPLAVVRRRASPPEFSVVVPAACGEVWNVVRGVPDLQLGRHVAVYLDAECNLEIGVEVSDGFTGAGHVVRSSTPAGKVATVAHLGPYAGLAAAHAAIQSWCRAAGHHLAGPSWEIYGHWTDDPAALRTDVFYLL